MSSAFKKPTISPFANETPLFIASQIPLSSSLINKDIFSLYLFKISKVPSVELPSITKYSTFLYFWLNKLWIVFSIVFEEFLTTVIIEILSSFSIVPKSAGYNYGTDASLEKKYELTISDNLNPFISFLSGFNLNQCTWRMIPLTLY